MHGVQKLPIAGAVVRVLVVDPALKMLILVQSKDRTPRYELPGGHIEPDELPAVAAIREVKEETGIAVAKLRAHAYIDRHTNLSKQTVWRTYFFSTLVIRPYKVTIDHEEIVDYCLTPLNSAREMRTMLDRDSLYFLDRIHHKSRS